MRSLPPSASGALTRLVAPACLAALALLPAACGAHAAAARNELLLTGSSTVAPLAAEIARRFEAAHPGVRVDVQTGGSGKGIADARSGAADIGMASRALKEGEEGLEVATIARDGVCVIVHASNPVRDLSDAEVVAIYRGEIPTWSELGEGLPEGDVVVVNKAEGRATLEVFLGYFGLSVREIRSDVVIGDNQQGIKTVAGNPAAIAYVSIGTAEIEREGGAAIRLLPVGGVQPTAENVASGDYPLSRPLNLLTRGKPTGLAREFVEYASSPAVRDLVEAQAFVPPRR